MRVRFVVGFLIAVPVALWLWVLVRYAANVPSNDDYALLEFIDRWHDPTQSWAARFADLIALHNTHRIIYDRLISLGSYYLTGQLNFLLLIWLGNLALGGICWQLWRGFRQLGQPIWYFLPIPYWLFSLQSHENMFWAMASLQNFTVIWFVLEALHQLHRRVPLIWPLLLSVAATLTSGNGILAFLVGTLLLVSQQRRDRSLLVWGISTALALGLMLGLSSVHHDRTPFLGWLPNACLALGGAFTNEVNTGLPLAGGALLAAAMLIAIGCWVLTFGNIGQRLRQLPMSAEWLAFGLFTLTTALLLAMHRLPDELLRERYKVYAHLMLGLVYLLVLATVSGRLRVVWAAGVTLGAILMNVSAFHACLPRIIVGFQQRQADAFNFQANQSTLSIPYTRQPTDSLLARVHRQGVYRFPETLEPPASWVAVPSTDSLRISSFQDDLVRNSALGEHPCYMKADNEHITFHLADGTDHGNFLVAESEDHHSYLFPGSPAKGSFRDFIMGKGPFKPGFSALFLSSRLLPGNYRVRLLRIANDRYQLMGAGQPLEIRSVY